MPYIKITNKCNMFCEHCCVDAKPNGRHMSRKVYVKALELFDDECISLGGGEPTLHPHFWEFLGLALAKSEYVWLATNGSQTRTSLALARLAKKGVLGVALSQDQYHDSIDEAVVRAFTKDKKPSYFGDRTDHDLREIRNVSENVIAKGRAKNWGKKGCPCDDVIVKPSGKIWACGCKTKQLGTVWNPDPLVYKLPNLGCWKSAKAELEEQEKGGED